MTCLARRRSALAASVVLALSTGAAQAASPDLVVSQVYGANASANAYNQDYVEIFNRGSTAVSLGGKTVQYASATGTGNFAIGATLPNVTLQPGRYYLVGLNKVAGGTSLAVDFDGGNAVNMAGAAGKVIIANSTSGIGCNGGSTACTPAQLALIVDLVGYGTTPNFYEGSGRAAAPGNTTATFRNNNGCTDTDDNAADFTAGPTAPRNGSTAANVCSGGTPTISINDVTQVEGNAGTSTFTFTVGLSAPAPAGGVTFDIATSDGTATTADNDYVARSLTGQSIPAGSSSYSFDVTVKGDTVAEVNQSFNVTLSNVVGANVGDASGLGTIQNDDGVVITPINQIQGSATESPYKGQTLTTEGVVTQVRSNNFYIQSTAARDDGNPATSEGILVFNALPAGLGAGDIVQVTGPVIEYLPVPNTFPVTQFGSASNIVDVGDAPLPAAKELTAADFSAALLTPDVLEPYEGMYVHIASGKIVSPTRFTGTSTANEFEVVVGGVQRPMREPGVSIFDNYAFPRAFSPVYFDANQERIKLYPATGAAPQVDARGSVGNVYGTLTYYGASTAENSWQVYYDPAQITINSGLPAQVVAQGANEVTIAGYNLEWFGSDPQYGALADRIPKAGAVICDWLQAPDILGTVEVDGNPGGVVEALKPLGDYINANCASQPNYAAYMLGTGDQSLGFLVKTSAVGAVPRVQLQDVDPAPGIQFVQQHGAGTRQMLADPADAAKLRPYPFTDHVANPSHESTKLLNDRPPLRLKAVVNFADGRQYPVTVIVVHQKALGDNTDVSCSGNGTTPCASSTSLGYKDYGAQSRAKRAEQAYELAQLVKDAQAGNLTGTSPGEKVVVVGDFNSFGFNDGYVDVMGITTGNPAPDAQVLLPYTSPLNAANGLVVDDDETYNFIADPEERYSYNFDSINQVLDHALFSKSLLADPAIDDVSVDHARVNSDFRTNLQKVFNAPYNTTTNLPVRTSDHDPVRVKVHVIDSTAPSISHTLIGTLGNNGWYTGNVVVDWTVVDDGISSSTGCGDVTLSNDTLGASYTCTATSEGGTASQTTTNIKRDATAPTLNPIVPSPLLRGQSYTANPNASDATSGIASASCGALDTSTLGTKGTSCTATDNAGNSTSLPLSYTVTTTCSNDGYSGMQLTWCRNICEMGYTGTQQKIWIQRWMDRYHDKPYCLVAPAPILE